MATGYSTRTAQTADARQNGGTSARWPRLLPPLLLIFAARWLARPSGQPSPLQEQNDSLVVVLDRPRRCWPGGTRPPDPTRKIRDLLAAREGVTGGLRSRRPVVTLTDRRTVEGMLAAVDPIIMPAQGNWADLGSPGR